MQSSYYAFLTRFYNIDPGRITLFLFTSCRGTEERGHCPCCSKDILKLFYLSYSKLFSFHLSDQEINNESGWLINSLEFENSLSLLFVQLISNPFRILPFPFFVLKIFGGICIFIYCDTVTY